MVAWARDRNNKVATIDWQFTAEDARIKLRRLYHTLHMIQGNRQNHDRQTTIFRQFICS